LLVHAGTLAARGKKKMQGLTAFGLAVSFKEPNLDNDPADCESNVCEKLYR